MNTEDIAKIAHNTMRVYALSLGHKDKVNAPWSHATKDQKAASIAGVEFCMSHPKASHAQIHDVWCANMEAAGWTYAEVKDIEAKKHPAVTSYHSLSPDRQVKNALFQAIVRELKPHLTEGASE